MKEMACKLYYHLVQFPHSFLNHSIMTSDLFNLSFNLKKICFHYNFSLRNLKIVYNKFINFNYLLSH